MNREDIIAMAREAGSEAARMPDLFPHLMDVFERFAALVAAAKEQEMLERIRHIIVQAEERGAAAERDELQSLETDAHFIFNNPPSECSQEVRDVIEWYASSIRARGSKPD